jgi:predicted nucleic acid-binding protein
MALVVDASVALAWALPDEASDYADAVLEVAEREGLRVPGLWALEVANGIAMAHSRGRITAAEVDVFLKALSRLRIDLVGTPFAVEAIRAGVAFAARFGLTAYDAAYVSLALSEGLALATLDGKMKRATLEVGGAIFSPE